MTSKAGMRNFQKRHAAICAACMFAQVVAAVACVRWFAPSDMHHGAVNSVIVLCAVLAAAAAASLAASWWLVTRSLWPVATLTDALRDVDVDSLGHRVQEGRFPAEFRELANLFNRMMDRLESSFDASRRFTSDASHELNTPLAILMGKLDLAVQREDLDPAMREMCAELLEQAAQLKAITESLLLLSRSDNGRLKLFRENLNLSQIVADLAEDIRLLAPHLTTDVTAADNVMASVDPALLNRVLYNLASNAIKYSHKDGRIALKLKSSGTETWLSVSNMGRGISEQHREQIFDRFYRGDASRSRKTGGLGLGLSLAREIARAHGGDLVLLEADPNGWTTFVLRLPAQG